jgi:hypothetical protein
METVLGIISDVVGAVGSVLDLFTKPVVLPFVGLAFVSAAVGTAKKLVPSKKK